MKALKDGTFEKRVGRRGYKPHGEDPDANVDKYKEYLATKKVKTEIAVAETERKRNSKTKEPVRIRFKELANGNKSVYLSINVNGRRTYDYLRLYLIPEVDAAAREQNKQTMQAVYAIKAQRIMSITNGIAGLKDKSRIKMRLVDWLEIFRDAQVERGRQSARNWVNSVLNAVREHSPNVTLAEMTKEYCNGFMVFLLNDYITYKHTHPSKSTVMNYLKCLKAAFNMAIEEEIMDDNPVLRLRMDVLKGGGTKREYLTVDEVKRLIDTPCKREDIKAAFLFSCFCGLRISDVKSLKWKNIITEGDKTRVEILQYKTKQPLYLPLNKQALRWMPERGSASDEDNVFPTLPSKNYDCIPEWSRAAGISKHVTYHVSRHTFATMELTMGADLYTTSKLLGHTEVRTTQIYAKSSTRKRTRLSLCWTVRSKNKMEHNNTSNNQGREDSSFSLLPQCNECTFANGVGGICGTNKLWLFFKEAHECYQTEVIGCGKLYHRYKRTFSTAIPIRTASMRQERTSTRRTSTSWRNFLKNVRT